MIGMLVTLAMLVSLLIAAVIWVRRGRRPATAPDLLRADQATAVTPEEAARDAADKSAWMLGGDGGG